MLINNLQVPRDTYLDDGAIAPARRLRLSIIIEWANTRLNGVPRAWGLFAALSEQWQALVEGAYPETLPPEAVRFIQRLDSRPEVFVVSGVALSAQFEGEMRARLGERFAVNIAVAEGLEYYPLKNHGAQRANGDLLLFVDSDVLPDGGWLAHLLGSFARADVDVVCSQTYVTPNDVFARAFAVGWRYPTKEDPSPLHPLASFFCNSIAFRSASFPPAGFPAVGRRSRGAATLLGQALRRQGIGVWQNPSAAVAHPPPAGFRHLVIRAIADGRDQYMARGEHRHFYGLARSQALAVHRLSRAVYRALRHRRRVGLRPWELPAVLAICATYYALYALGGVMTHVSPGAMGRRFRV